MSNRYCQWCGHYQEETFEHHKGSSLHRFHYLLYIYNKNKKNEVKDRRGITVSTDSLSGMSSFNKEKGNFIVRMSPADFTKMGKNIQVKFNIENSSNQDVYVVSIVLHPYSVFHLKPGENVNYLQPGDCCQSTVCFNLQEETISSIKIPVCFTVQPVMTPETYFSIYRQIVLYINEGSNQEEDNKISPYQKKKWTNVVEVHEAMHFRKFRDMYPIPWKYKRIFNYGLQVFDTMASAEHQDYLSIMSTLDEQLEEENYEKRFQYLLWLEEAANAKGLTEYNMTNVNVTLGRHDYLQLDVPGLAEKRPSIIVGDFVRLRLIDDHTVYEGIVQIVADQYIYIKNVSIELIEILKYQPDVELEVSFCLSRLIFERMHAGVANCIAKGLMGSLFPEARLGLKPTRVKLTQLYNKLITTNKEQLLAVESIVSCTSGQAPYIIFGPPGTGKTVTVVEAILQIKKHYPSKTILVCAPANAACDMIALKLSEFCIPKEMLRIHSLTRDRNTIPLPIVKYSNILDESFYHIPWEQLIRFNIVISTLHLIGKYADNYSPDFVFIDEAAQATEPECCIPISLLRPGKQVILAGDPKQLGPSTCSIVAQKYGIDISLMERLMKTNDLYQPTSTNPLKYNSDYLTMLAVNYRSHRDILQIPNELFYDNSLQPLPHSDPLSKIFVSLHLFRLTPPRAPVSSSVEFCGVLSKEKRTGSSPSYFNEEEIQMVVKCVDALLRLPNCRVACTDIGIIAPYIRQVYRIKQRLEQARCSDVEVGTTEAFQGREKRVMIISTVRAQNCLLKYDKKYKLGFVKDERRFNVAITRAKSKLIVIGNPLCLGTDEKCWGRYIEFCKQMYGYHGIPYEPRTSLVCHEIAKRLSQAIPDNNNNRKKQN